MINSLHAEDLDTADFEHAVQRTFGITIENTELEHLTTVGDLYAVVLRKLRWPRTPVCLTAAAFYRVRRAFVETFGLRRDQVHPSGRVCDLVGQPPRSAWMRYGQALGTGVPDLRRPRWVHATLLLAGVASFAVVVGRLSMLDVGPALAMLAGGLAVAVVYAVGYRLTKRLAHCVPVETAGEMAQSHLQCHFAHVADAVGAVSEKAVWDVYAAIVAREFGTRREEITPETRFCSKGAS